MALTKKRRAWLEEYFKCWNATEAARRVGYAHPNTQGPRLLLDVGVQDEIQRRLDELKMGADEVLLRLSEQARLDPGLFVEVEEIRDEDTNAIIFKGPRANWRKIQEAGLTHLVKAIYWTKYGPRIEFHDAQRALELIGKHHGLFIERQEITGKDGGPVEIKLIWGDDQNADDGYSPETA